MGKPNTKQTSKKGTRQREFWMFVKQTDSRESHMRFGMPQWRRILMAALLVTYASVYKPTCLLKAWITCHITALSSAKTSVNGQQMQVSESFGRCACGP